MGVTFTTKIDPHLKEEALDVISGAIDIQDVYQLQREKDTVWKADAYVQLLRNWMIGQAYKPLRKAVYGYAKGCMLATPVKTGNARRNWHVTSSRSPVDPSYIDFRGTPKTAEEAATEMEAMLQKEVQQAIGKAQGHSAGPRESIQVTNYTPYIGSVEARHGMTANGLAEMLNEMEANS